MTNPLHIIFLTIFNSSDANCDTDERRQLLAGVWITYIRKNVRKQKKFTLELMSVTISLTP